MPQHHIRQRVTGVGTLHQKDTGVIVRGDLLILGIAKASAEFQAVATPDVADVIGELQGVAVFGSEVSGSLKPPSAWADIRNILQRERRIVRPELLHGRTSAGSCIVKEQFKERTAEVVQNIWANGKDVIDNDVGKMNF